MKKLKCISILVLLLSFGTIFAQSSERILSELEELFKNNNNPSELYYNTKDEILDIHGYQVPLGFTHQRYEESDGAKLGLYCRNRLIPECIYDPNTKKNIGLVEIPMKDKENVYKAINLINQLTEY